jgi:hypothetical protein
MGMGSGRWSLYTPPPQVLRGLPSQGPGGLELGTVAQE